MIVIKKLNLKFNPNFNLNFKVSLQVESLKAILNIIRAPSYCFPLFGRSYKQKRVAILLQPQFKVHHSILRPRFPLEN